MPRIQEPEPQAPQTPKRRLLQSPVLRHAVIAFGSALWLAGLWAQFHSLSAAAMYLVISLLMVLVVVATSERPVKRVSSD